MGKYCERRTRGDHDGDRPLRDEDPLGWITPAAGGAATSTLVRHYTDGSDNPGWVEDTTVGTSTRYGESLGPDIEQLSIFWFQGVVPVAVELVPVGSVGSTTTSTGLTIHADLDHTVYEKGITITYKHFNALPLHRHEFHSDWNYTLKPEDR